MLHSLSKVTETGILKAPDVFAKLQRKDFCKLPSLVSPLTKSVTRPLINPNGVIMQSLPPGALNTMVGIQNELIMERIYKCTYSTEIFATDPFDRWWNWKKMQLDVE